MKSLLILLTCFSLNKTIFSQINFALCEIDEINSAQGVAFGDLNNDGKIDLISCGFQENKVIIYLKNDTSYNKHIVLNITKPSKVEVTDIDHDGNIDIIVTARVLNSLVILENDGNEIPIFTRHEYNYGSVPSTLKIGDLNTDGLDDILIGYAGSNSIVLLENNGAFSFNVNTNFNTEINRPGDCEIIDLNSDGRLDFIFTDFFDDDISVYYNSDNSDSYNKEIIANLDGPLGVRAEDMDGDGNIDLIVNSFNSGLNMFLSFGQLFQKVVIDSTLKKGNGIELTDLDNDGDFDIVANELENDNLFYYNNDNGVFTKVLISDIGLSGGNIKITDIDNDEDSDILITGPSIDKFVVLKNDLISSLKNPESPKRINLFPNPTNGKVRIEINNEASIKSLLVYNSNGEIVRTYNDNIIDIGDLPASIYFIKIITEDWSKVKQLTKQ